MPVRCIVRGCKNRSHKRDSVSFFSLPRLNRPLLRKWLTVLGDPGVFNHSSRICEEHFTPSDFRRPTRVNSTDSAPPRKLLKPSAVPSVRIDLCANAQPAAATVVLQPCTHKRMNSEQNEITQKFGKENMTARHPTASTQTLPPPSPPTSTSTVSTQTPPPPAPRPCFCNGQPIPEPPPCCAPCCNVQNLTDEDPSSDSEQSELSDSSGSSYVPSEQDSGESDVEDEEEEEEHVQADVLSDHCYLVFGSSLHELFVKCNADPTCTSPITNLDCRHQGSLLVVTAVCSSNHTYIWKSGETVGKSSLGNILIAASTLFTGNTYTTLSEIASCLKLQLFSERTFYTIQKHHLFPAVKKMWTSYQQFILSEFQGEDNLMVAGDGRCDSPGHSATYGTYTIMEMTQNLILATNVVKVTEVENSYWMELEGLERCLRDLEEAGVRIQVLATDRHPQITKVMRKEHPEIDHEFDVWHTGKGVNKRLTLAAKRADCRDLNPWVDAVMNHFWWSAENCGGNEVELKERWTSVLSHIVGIHTWDHGTRYHKCDHPPLGPRAWLTAGSPSHKALQAIVMDKKLLNDMKQLVRFCHTGDLEAYHNVYLKYLPKRLAFRYEGMTVRTMLAAIDHNTNVGRGQAKADDQPRWKYQWSKSKKKFLVQQIKEPKNYGFRKDLVNSVIERLEEGNPATLDDVVHVPALARERVGGQERMAKADAVERHVSRFRN